MERLPQEIVLDILSRLPIPSLLQSKSVCRAWHSLIRDPMLVNKHFSHILQNDPTFIFHTNQYPIQNQLYFGDFSADHRNVITKKLPMPPLLNFQLVSSCNGLLCLRASSQISGLWVYNPFTKDSTQLPKLTKNHSQVGVLGFGFDPTTKNYKVVHMSCRYQRRICRASHVTARSALDGIPVIAATGLIESSVHVLRVGSSEWRNLGSLPFNCLQQRSQVLVNGKLHWVSYSDTTKHNITSFDLATEQFEDVPRPDCINLARRFDQLVALRGCLAAVSYHGENEELEIWVMKEYGLNESWVKEFSIGTYIPQILQQNGHEFFKNPRFYFPKRSIRVLCLLRSGEILLEYRAKALVVYDPRSGAFKDLQLTFLEIPRSFKVVVHVASLNWIDSFVNA